MLDSQFATLLGLGFLLGARHALDADHLVAISTLLSRHAGMRRCGMIGLSWGLGHSLMLLLVGAAVLLLNVRIPPALAAGLEMAVGGLLVWLGVSLASTLVRERWHVHPHDHDGTRHFHLHSHRRRTDHAHDHPGLSLRSVLVGMAHGLAGSAALMLLVLSSVPTVGSGLLYIAMFGLGSVLGMVGVGLVVSVPFVFTATRSEAFGIVLQGLASVASIVLGTAMLVGITLS